MALRNDLTTGNVRKLILKFAMPLVLSMLLQALYNAVDMFFVGRFGGTEALASVAVSGPIMNIMIQTISAFSIGVSIVVGTHLGSGNAEKQLKSSINTAITLFLIISLVGTILGFVLTPFIISLINTPAVSVQGAIVYLRTIFAGISFMFGYNLIGAFQRGFGDSRTSLYFVAVATGVNVILDYILIGPLQMGPFGAAIATVFAQAVSLILGIIYFRRKKHVVTFSLKELMIDKIQLKLIVRMGLPPAIQTLLNTISGTTVMGIVNGFGVSASAAYGVTLKMEAFAMLPSNAIGMAVATFTSQNIGAGKSDRALKGLWESVIISTVLLCLTGVVVYVFAPSLAAIFVTNPDVIGYATRYLRIIVFAYPMMGSMFPLIGFIRGSGNSIFSLYSSVLTQYVVRIPLALVLTRSFGFIGVAIASGISPLTAVSIYSFAVFSGRWKNSKEVRRSMELRKSQAESNN